METNSTAKWGEGGGRKGGVGHNEREGGGRGELGIGEGGGGREVTLERLGKGG